MNAIVLVALRRPLTFVVMSILLILFGTMAILKTPTDIFPAIRIPVIAVVWNYNGLSPQDMSGRVVYYYERALTATVANIEHIESQSLYGAGIVKIYFQPGTDIAAAQAQVTSASLAERCVYLHGRRVQQRERVGQPALAPGHVAGRLLAQQTYRRLPRRCLSARERPGGFGVFRCGDQWTVAVDVQQPSRCNRWHPPSLLSFSPGLESYVGFGLGAALKITDRPAHAGRSVPQARFKSGSFCVTRTT
jgi:hypothetical protein